MMKLFERGKLLGRFNVIDFLIVVIVLGVLVWGGLYLKKSIIVTKSSDKFSYVIELKDVPDELVQYIVEGEQVNETERLYSIGKILLKTIKPMINIVENKNAGAFEEKVVPNKKDVFITVQAGYEISGDGINTIENIKTDGGFEVKAGKYVSIKTKSYSGQGYIVSIDK